MSRLNPGNPDVAGSEWFGSATTQIPIVNTVGRGPIIVATATHAVDTIYPLLRPSELGLPPAVVVDVYDLDAGDPWDNLVSTALCVPASNRSNVAGWVKSSAGVESAYDVNAHNNVDDVVAVSSSLTVGASDQIRYQPVNPTVPAYVRYNAAGTFVDGESGLTSVSITAKRISYVEVITVVENDTAQPVRFDGQLVIGGNAYNSDTGPQTVEQNSPLKRITFGFYTNPSTDRPWCNADAIALTDTTNGFGIAVLTKAGAGNFIVTTMMLQFRYLTESRLVTGFGVSTATLTDRWAPCALLNPADLTAASWAKTAGSRYLLVYSLTNPSPVSSFTIAQMQVAGHETDPSPGTQLTYLGLTYGAVPIAAPVVTEGMFPTLLVSAGVVQPDSNPYGYTEILGCGAANPVVTQRISTEIAQAYGTISVLVGADSDGAGGARQDDALTVKLKRTSDNATLAGPVDIAPGDVLADGKYHVTRVRFAPVTLGLAQSVYIECSSSSVVPWRLPMQECRTPTMLTTDATSLLAAVQSVGGTADHAGSDLTSDFPWSIGVAPSPPTGLAVTTATMANVPALSVHSCKPASIEMAHLTWTATVLGADFGYYEIQRQSDDGSTWNTVEVITLESSVYFNDLEGPRGTAAFPVLRYYRIRVVRGDGGYSDWVTFTGLAVSVADSADIVLASNQDPGSTLAFQDLGGVHSWDQLQTARGKVQPILGRDLPVAFWPAEAGGEQFVRTLAVAYNDPAVGSTVTPDRAMFDPALALLQNRTLSYVSYADGYGRTWLTSPAVLSPGPTRTEHGGQYTIPVQFTQVASIPVAVTDDIPWPEPVTPPPPPSLDFLTDEAGNPITDETLDPFTVV